MIKNFIWHLFSDKSPLNAAIAIGVGAFLMMTIFALADIGTGLVQKDLVVSDTIYHSFGRLFLLHSLNRLTRT